MSLQPVSRMQQREKMVNNLLNNTRNLGRLIKEIADNAISTTDIVELDERNCRKVDIKSLVSLYYTELAKNGVSQDSIKNIIDQVLKKEEVVTNEVDSGLLESIKAKASKLRTIRLQEALQQLEMFLRVSYMFDEGGYQWSKYYNREQDEPEKEKFWREMIDEQIRQKFRKSGLIMFLGGIYTYLDAIRQKDINFLIENLDKLIKNEEFTSRIAIIFGMKDENGVYTTSYASPQQIEKVWKIVHVCVRNSINFCHAKGVRDLKIKKVKNGEIIEKTVELNYAILAEEWGITSFPEYTD